MRVLVTTENIPQHRKFDLWRDVSYERLIPSEARKTGDGPFEGMLEAADVGGVLITRSTFGALTTEVTPGNIRRHGKQHTLSATIRLAGMAASTQNDRSLIHNPGEIVIVDRSRPVRLDFEAPTQSLVIEIDRDRIERLLGPAALYSALKIDAGLGSTKLAVGFFKDLVDVQHRLPPETAARMASIGVDLLVASIAERMALETPRPLHGTVLVQRAKAYLETNLDDQTLCPAQLALAMGVSLRRLQELFRERGRNISDWIWERRLDVAAARLTDPRCLHLSIGAIAHGCGFSGQAHFSRRFRDRYGMTPSKYKRVAAQPKQNRP
ncbi:helix-turn-helix domain-containing protein [Methylobacterium sp. J-090]|uniref:helix-turn-helix domain-containing protein n=1 Tax=Methylobacterium sp. J-090 TaxID=2836666 RepID=UPI001FBBAC98|nr:helix-turn-helix domain-containing protein [Methylobacterium sp. J-090]MCJ2081489.1 helix-turn-helix domain-containing protein [Methylobacterium sp. J-090]